MDGMKVYLQSIKGIRQQSLDKILELLSSKFSGSLTLNPNFKFLGFYRFNQVKVLLLQVWLAILAIFQCLMLFRFHFLAVDIMRYLDKIIAAHRPYPEWTVCGKCDNYVILRYFCTCYETPQSYCGLVVIKRILSFL